MAFFLPSCMHCGTPTLSNAHTLHTPILRQYNNDYDDDDDEIIINSLIKDKIMLHCGFAIKTRWVSIGTAVCLIGNVYVGCIIFSFSMLMWV